MFFYCIICINKERNMFDLKTSENVLENELFKNVYDKTPDYVKNLNLMNFDNDGEFSFILKKVKYETN